MFPSEELSLGPLPWSEETLTAAVWRNFHRAQDWVDEHPGRDLQERLESIQAVLRVFNRTASTFKSELARFHLEAHDGRLFQRNRRADLEAFEERFRELLYVFASSAITLVDQTRALSMKVLLPNYDKRIKEDFAENPRHRFVQELRVDVVHVILHKPGWQLTSGKGERTSKFMIWPKQLRRSGEYNARARQFLRDHADGIDLGLLIEDYNRQVRQFHSWLSNAVDTVAGVALDDYRRCSRHIKAVGARSSWNIILKQVVIIGKRDPYAYLDQYLTSDEHSEVMSLPFRSRAQVDRIIELVDEFGACDADLRRTAYEAFGVGDT